MIRRILAIVLVAVLATAVAACGSGSQYWKQDADAALNARILDLRGDGTSVPLRSLTDFEWDAVFLYEEGASNDGINADVGTVMFRPGGYMMIEDALAVFTLKGSPVRALILPPLVFRAGRHPADVVLEDGIRFVDPPLQ
jgi:hypothetical protein